MRNFNYFADGGDTSEVPPNVGRGTISIPSNVGQRSYASLKEDPAWLPLQYPIEYVEGLGNYMSGMRYPLGPSPWGDALGHEGEPVAPNTIYARDYGTRGQPFRGKAPMTMAEALMIDQPWQFTLGVLHGAEPEEPASEVSPEPEKPKTRTPIQYPTETLPQAMPPGRPLWMNGQPATMASAMTPLATMAATPGLWTWQGGTQGKPLRVARGGALRYANAFAGGGGLPSQVRPYIRRSKSGTPVTVSPYTRRSGGSGLIKSAVPGRTDRIPMSVPGGSYVLPADVVSAAGQNNTLAGGKKLDGLFGPNRCIGQF